MSNLRLGAAPGAKVAASPTWWSQVTDGSLFPWLMLSPALMLLAFVLGVPLVSALTLSVQHFVLTRPLDYEAFVGLDNYVRMLSDPDFWAAIGRSAFYTVGVVVGTLGLGWLTALLVHGTFRGRAVARMLFILPWAVPGVAAAMVWGIMYDPNFGIINRFLGYLPFGIADIEWLLDRDLVLPSLIVVQVWNEFPIAFLFILAGLQTIPLELYEAAEVDGAGSLARFRYVTLPMMRYVVAVTMLIVAIFGFRSFAVIYVLTGGGPAAHSETLIVETYNEAFRRFDFSYSATLGVASVIVSLLLTAVYLRLTLRRDLAGSPS